METDCFDSDPFIENLDFELKVTLSQYLPKLHLENSLKVKWKSTKRNLFFLALVGKQILGSSGI